MPPQETLYSEFKVNNEVDTPAAKEKITVGRCQIHEVGLERFIKSCCKVLDLNMNGSVIFNLNDRGILHEWKDVFQVERTYSKCLGITDRIYQCHGYVHRAEEKLAYFILEEENKRVWSFLPVFNVHVMIFCRFNDQGTLTKVDVRYDQMSFFLECLGLMRIHTWVNDNIITPIAVTWMHVLISSGVVINPLTFVAQIFLGVWLLYQYLMQ